MKIILAAGALLLGLNSTKADLDIPEGRESRAPQILLLAQAPEAEPAPVPGLAPSAPVAPATPPADPFRAAQAAQAKLAAEAGGIRAEGGGGRIRLQSVVSRTGQDGNSLVVRSSDVDPKSIANIEEDMNVMSHILEKAAEKRGDEEDRRAMGIRLSLFGDGLKSMQIEGYGAIFLIKVNFPLSGPPENLSESKPSRQTNSAWEEAKREVYGQRKGIPGGEFQTMPGKPFEEPYNPKRVDELKESLINALKNASNVRGLKEDDSITVVVTASGSSDFVYRKVIVQQALPGDADVVTQNQETKSASMPKSTLTIKARKSDVDALAKGKMDADEFRKKVAIALY